MYHHVAGSLLSVLLSITRGAQGCTKAIPSVFLGLAEDYNAFTVWHGASTGGQPEWGVDGGGRDHGRTILEFFSE